MNILYAFSLCIIIFAALNLASVLFTGFYILDEVTARLVSEDWGHLANELFIMRDMMQMSVSSLFLMIVLLTLLCMLLIPVVIYLHSTGRGYDAGILRILGMGKAKTWITLVAENIFLSSVVFIVVLGGTISAYRYIMLSVLSIGDVQRQLLTDAGIVIDIYTYISAGFLAFIGIFLLMSIIIVYTLLIIKKKPLKLLNEHK
jgi:predicted lysophospholipase L1 biosynthesis ABC-type transport system permease subunit